MNQALTSIVSNSSCQEIELLNQFEVVNKLGVTNKRKFNEVYLIINVFSNDFFVLKKMVKTNQNKHLWGVLKAESTFDFSTHGLPKTILFCENESEIILIRNFQEGIPLNEYWKKLKSKNQMDFVKKMIAALIPFFDELAKKKIVHCDIKPSNILVQETDGELSFSLIDFGMALKQDKIAERKTLFALGYSAPEIILNRLHLVDQSSDIFALGISIWQLFAGKLPLTHPNPSVMTNLQITHPLPNHGNIEKSLQSILNKMCYKHLFKTPPNLINIDELDQFLAEAQKSRYLNLTQILEDLNQIKARKFLGLFSKK